jgi:hypothetical protein
MRVRFQAWTFRVGLWLCTLVAMPAAAITPTVAASMTHELSNVWVPATAYGLTLIAAFSKKQK